MLCFTIACYGGHAKAKGGRTYWCQEPSTAGTLLGIIALPPLRSATPKVFGLPFLAFEESAGSFDHKQVGDALRAAVNGTLAATVPFSRCRWVLTLRLVELVTNASKGL